MNRFSALIFLSVFSGLTEASLLGDDVLIEYHIPDFERVVSGSQWWVTVQEGERDVPLLFDSRFKVNPEAFSILIDYMGNYGQQKWGTFNFNGPVISDLDFSDGSTLIDVVLEKNLVAEFPSEPGWGRNRIVIGSDYVGFNWGGLIVTPESYLHARLITSSTKIREPTTLALMGLGLAGIGYRRHMATIQLDPRGRAETGS